MFVIVGGFFFSSRRRHTRCALVTGVQTCALPIWLQPRPRKGLVDVARDGAGIVEPEAVMLEGRHQTKGLTFEPAGRPVIAVEDVELDAVVEIGRASCRERVCQYV